MNDNEATIHQIEHIRLDADELAGKLAQLAISLRGTHHHYQVQAALDSQRTVARIAENMINGIVTARGDSK